MAFLNDRAATLPRPSAPPYTAGAMRILRTLYTWRWLLLGFGLGALLVALPPPEGLSVAGQRTLAMAAVATLFFITEPVPLPAVALLIAVFQVLLGLGSGNEVARSFMSDSVFFILGSLMISVALVKQKLDRRIAYGIMRVTGPDVLRILFGFTAVSALLSSLIGEHTVAAMMLPVALAILGHVRHETPNVHGLAAVLLFAIAYGTAIAGIGTPSGGARNAIMIDYWRQLADVEVGYSGWPTPIRLSSSRSRSSSACSGGPSSPRCATSAGRSCGCDARSIPRAASAVKTKPSSRSSCLRCWVGSR